MTLSHCNSSSNTDDSYGLSAIIREETDTKSTVRSIIGAVDGVSRCAPLTMWITLLVFIVLNS